MLKQAFRAIEAQHRVRFNQIQLVCMIGNSVKYSFAAFHKLLIAECARSRAAYKYGVRLVFGNPVQRLVAPAGALGKLPAYALDRKSTRLNSSHVAISYAVFC